jgi:D-aspartate ligase
MRPPFVVKPADSSEYWRHKFDGMKKVYFPDSLDEAKRIAEKIYASGYSGKILIQEYVGKRNGRSSTAASVLTVFCDKNARAVRAVLGDVLLEELGNTARGNYSAIVTRPLDSISKKLLTLLEEIGYTGVANIDILTSVEGSYCLELNARQGRSFDYLRISGVNLAKLFVQEMLGEKTETDLAYRDALWRSVRWRTVEKHTKNKALLKRAYRLERGGRSGTPYNFKSDKSPGRRFYVMVHLHREAKRYKTYS